jgi:signal transduction histidine kinase
MKLRTRIVLAHFALSLLLVAPAVLGLFGLRELQQVAQNLRTRDAVGALVLGRLQTAVGEVDHWCRAYLALATSPEERAEARERVDRSVALATAALARLDAVGYAQETATAAARWQTLREAIRREQALVESGDVAAADALHAETVNPALAAMDQVLEPIGAAINRGGEAQVRRAQEVAAGTATTTLLALAIALAAAILIAGWLTRSILHPVRELRRGMSVVAAGDFEPDVDIAPDRPDELGDLARSFATMTAQLAELDRLKAEFVSIASHELRTPLSVIRGYVSLLQDGIYGPVPEQQRKILGSIADQTDRLGRLVQQLLDISRLEAGGRLELRPIDLHGFLAELATSFDVLALQSQIDFRLDLADDLPAELPADPDRLNEVVGNLLSNAFKFTPRGGRIRLHAGREGGSALIEVSDTGVGIPPEQLPRIFEKFYQIENEAQPRSVGSGLGLAIAREIVEAHGGTITAESIVGKGTTFRVCLPLEAVTGAPALVHPATLPEPTTT